MNRQWIERTLRREECESVPYNFMFSPPALRLAVSHYGDDLERSLNLPIRMSGPRSIKPLYATPEAYGSTIRDEFGVVWSTSEIDRGSPIGPCLPEPTLAGYALPDPSRQYRFEHLAAWCSAQAGHYRILWVGDLWERAVFMRGMDGLLADVILNPSFVASLLENLTEYILCTMAILFERFAFEAIAVSDDYGAQRAMVISPDHWRQLVRPCLARIYGFAKDRGRSVFHHSCGNILPIVGDLIDLGLDILHPIQPEAMDVELLKREFGGRLTFCGGVPTQRLLVQAGPDAVRREVRRLKTVMGRGGGYILEPGITIQADVPLENMVAMMDEAMRPGR